MRWQERGDGSQGRRIALAVDVVPAARNPHDLALMSKVGHWIAGSSARQA
jgi:hypothetical protein